MSKPFFPCSAPSIQDMPVKNLDPDLKNAWLMQLKKEWENANYTFFNRKMNLPDVDLSNSEKTLGRWTGGSQRRLLISVRLIYRFPWEAVQDVLYHEMAHQYVEEVLQIRDSLPHGEVFQKICRERGIDPSATGNLPCWEKNRDDRFKTGSRNHKIINKAHKLFALARSDNLNEAHAAMTKAHSLLLKHNLSLLEAENRENYIRKQVGEIGRKNPVKSLVGIIISKFFFVESIWTFSYDRAKNKEGRVLEIYGTQENVEIAEYVHDYLHNVSEILWKEYQSKKKMSGNKYRRTFLYGLLNGLYNKLNSGEPNKKPLDLVWKGDPKLKEFYRRRNPKISTSACRYSSSCDETYRTGFARGKKLIIHKGMHGKRSGKTNLLN